MNQMNKSKSSKNSGALINKDMNDQTYQLRSEVMKYIYEAKEALNRSTQIILPRITVRITKDHESILGMGRMGKNIIWISQRAVESNRFDLRSIVFHEILHAVFKVNHDESCPLMKPVHSPLTKIQAQQLFIKWAEKANVKNKYS